MRLFDFLFAGKRMEEIKMALVGKHVFDNLITIDQKNRVIALANQRFSEGTSSSDKRTMDDLNLRARFVFFALAMAELEINHGLKGFQWTYVRNPFMVQTYDERLWGATTEMLKNKYGLDMYIGP